MTARINYIIAALMVLACVALLPYASSVRLIQRINFEVAVALILAVYLWRFNPFMSLFLVLSTFSLMFPFYDKFSYFAFQAIFYGMVLYAVIVTFVTDINPLLNAMCVIALCNVGYMLLQSVGVDPILSPISGNGTPVVGMMGNPNLTSALIAFAFPAFMRDKWRYLIPVIVVGLVMAKALGGIVAVCAGLIFYGAMNGHKFWPVVLISCVGIVYFLVTNHEIQSVTLRIEAWFETLKYYSQHWVFGSGIGHFKVQVGEYFLRGVNGLRWKTPHNEFIQGLFEMGILFPFVVVAYYVRTWRKFWQDLFVYRNQKEAVMPMDELVRPKYYPYLRPALIPMTALIVITVNAMVNFPFHIAPTAMIGVVWLGILDIKLRSPQEAQ